jgi:hypothetical protein
MSLETILFASAGFIGGIALMIFGFMSFKRYQRIRDTPSSRVRSVAVGMTEVKGKIRKANQESTYKHPIDGDDTVYYEREVEKYRHDDNGSNWETVLTEEVGDKFMLEDDTGKIEVKIEDNVALELEDARERETYSGIKPNEELPRALEGTNANNDSALIPNFLESSGRYRVTVTALYPDDFCYVLGKARPKEGSDTSSINEENIVIGNPEYDKNDGILDLGIFASTSYIISNQKEDELQKEEKWQGPGGFIIGLILSAICLFYLLQLFL